MKKKLFYPLILLGGILLFLSSCTKKEGAFLPLKEAEKISIQHENGFYLCEDRSNKNILVANRESVKGWEEFYIQFIEDSVVLLRGSRFTFIGIDVDGKLSGSHSNIKEAFKFNVSIIDSTFVLKAINGNLQVNSDDELYFSKERTASNSILHIQPIAIKEFPGFSTQQWFPLTVGLILLIASFILFYYKKHRSLSLLLLLLGSFSIRLFIALLTDHFYVWDEQFHALVAKNMVDHPFQPMLYKNPVLPYSFKNWTANHIWLHKQPLFLWQMALSIKLFGLNVFAVRLPSILMSTFVSLFIYRMGNHFINHKVGYLSAFLFVFSYFNLDLISGVIHTDHNDTAFLFYLSASVWAWVEYEHAEKKRKWVFLLLIGLFSGAAILVKWLTGILVYSGWGLSIILIKERRLDWRNYLDLLKSAAITLAVFLPWQLYILWRYPTISNYEYAFNTKHFYEVIENHGGNFWWHFNSMQAIYKIDTYILLACFVLFVFAIKKYTYKIGVITFFICIYLFYSIAATKMIAFTFSISFLIYLALGFTIYIIWNTIEKNLSKGHTFIGFLVLISMVAYMSFISFDLETIKKKHSTWVKDNSSIFTKRLKTTPLIKELPHQIDNIEDYVIFNCHNYEKDNILVMFYTDAAASYVFLPDEKMITTIKDKGYKIAVFDNKKLPSYILNDSEIKKISGYWN